MRLIGDHRRFLLWAVVVAILFGFALGWYARIWTTPTPEERAHEQQERLKERAREWMR